MDQGPAAQGGQHEPSRPAPASARARIAAAVRYDVGGAAAPRPPVTAPEASQEPPPQLPDEDGLQPVHRLGGGTWLVREARSGERFVVRLCTGAPGPELDRSRAAARALVVELAGLEEQHVVAVHGLLGPAEEPVGVVEEFLGGGTLAELLAERGRLGPAEVAAVMGDAATGLAVLHGLGRCHGRLTARQILFRSSGPPARGADVPAAALRTGTVPGSPHDDVRALGALAWAALTGRAPAHGGHRAPLAALCPDAPPGLLRAVEAALAADPAARPTAAELAGRLTGLPEAPSRCPGSEGPASAAALPRGRRASVVGASVVGAVTVGLAVAAVALGMPADTAPQASSPVSSGPPGTVEPSVPAGPGRSAQRVPQDPADSDDPREALDELVARRGVALRTGDTDLLEQVYAPGAEAAGADLDVITRAAGGFADLELEVARAREVPPGQGAPERGTAAFVAEVRVDGYRGDPGPGVSVAPAGNGWVQTVVVSLVRGADGWRLARVEPAPEGTAVVGPDPYAHDPRG